MVRRLRLPFLLVLYLFSLSPLTVTTQLYAQKSRKVKQMEERRKRLLAEINETSALIKKTDNSRQVNLKRLNLLTQQVKARKKLIEALSGEIATADTELLRLTHEMDSLARSFDRRRELYIKAIQAMQHKDNVSEHLLFILSAREFEQGVRRARYLQEYSSWLKEEATALKTMHAQVEDHRKEIAAQQEERRTLLSERERERALLQKNEEESRQEVRRLNREKKSLESQLSQKRRQADQLNKEIEKQIAKEVAEAAKRASKKRSSTPKKSTGTSQPDRSSTPKGNYEMSQEEIALSGSFVNNKGKLPCPITGPYSIVGTFGKHAHESLSQVTINNNGIDLQGRSGANARAVFNGVVSRIFAVDGYHTSVIVRHGNYLTVYSNLSEVHVKTDQKVKTGQSLGKVYTDNKGEATLHFQLWKERTKQNPLPWIRR